MTNLIHILIAIRIAERDGIHPAHALNRVAAATRIAAAVERDARSMCKRGVQDSPSWGRFYLSYDVADRWENRKMGSYFMHHSECRQDTSLATRMLAVEMLEARYPA